MSSLRAKYLDTELSAAHLRERVMLTKSHLPYRKPGVVLVSILCTKSSRPSLYLPPDFVEGLLPILRAAIDPPPATAGLIAQCDCFLHALAQRNELIVDLTT